MTLTTKHVRDGYDSAVHGQCDDHLNRWPFAKEIYGVATTGPREWSVRIGVYGEWGTGKTSVLNFVDTLARKDGHIVIRFNPWEYSSKNALWHAFVQAVVSQLPEDGKASPRTWLSWVKKPVAPIANWIALHGTRIAEAVDDKKVTLAVYGIDLVKSFFLSNKADLERILTGLGDKRLIVLIDDLDRTNRELVPEMLFAIKEIMDIGGFVFICAFDPIVVGQVLGDYHKGFGDGLKFLEKIIDYPRWLPAPSPAALLTLARHDIVEHCSYVPIQAMEQVIALLPCNPRSLRQFIRLIRLLKPQIERHRPDELSWPIILAANVIKIRFPHLAIPLLEDPKLWHEVHGVTLMARDNAEEKLEKLVTEHLASITNSEGDPLSASERRQLQAPLVELARRLDAWTGIDEERMLYQLRIAEAPAAVTWKEFDDFVASWDCQRSAETVNRWIKAHCDAVGRNYQDVYTELFEATVKARQAVLSQAAGVLTEGGLDPMLSKAETLLTVLECLTFELGQLDKADKRLGEAQFELAFGAMTSHLGWTFTNAYKALREREKTYILRLVKEWSPDVTPLIRVLKPFADAFEHHGEGKEALEVRNQLCDIVVPKYARQLIERFREEGFIATIHGRGEGTYVARHLVLDVAGPLWGALREAALEVLASAMIDLHVHQNAHEMLRWFDYILREETGSGDAQAVERWLRDDCLRTALWTAAMSHPLNHRAMGQLSTLPGRLAERGLSVALPEWWTRTMGELGLGTKDLPSASPKTPDGDPS